MEFSETVMNQAGFLSATGMNAPKRRMIVFLMLFAWLTLLLVCPKVLHEASHPASMGEEEVSHVTAGSLHEHDSSYDDACCTPAPQAAVASAQKFDLSAYFILILVLPAIVTPLMALVALSSNRGLARSPRSTGAPPSLFFWTLWPQAPPR